MSLFAFLLKTSGRLVAVSVAAAALSGAGGVALIAMVHDALGRPDRPGTAAALAFAALCVTVAASRVVAQAAMSRLGQGAVAALAARLCRGVLALPLERFEAVDRGRLLAVLTEDVTIVAGTLVGIPQICLNLPLIAVCLGYVGWLSPALLACGAVFAAAAVGAYLAIVGPAVRRLQAARSAQDRFVGHVQTLVHGFRQLKQHRPRADAFLDQAVEPGARAVRDRAVAAQTLFALAEGWSDLAFFGFLGALVFVLPSVWSVDRSALVGAVLVVLYVMGPLDVLLTWIPALGRARASLARIEALVPVLDAGDGLPAVHALRVPEHSVVLDGVTYAYPGDDGDGGFALGPVDLELRAGEIVVLAGGNGSGKTTMVKVLCGLYPPASGRVLVDGRPVGRGEADREAYRQLFTVLFADGYLFRDLHGLDRPGLDAEANAGLERMGLAGRVRFEGVSYSTTDLSQGQRGRVALLSALLEDRPVCVFDEWAANQDAAFKRAFYREILPDLRAAGKAVLVISHDEDYHDVADRVVRLRDGHPAEVAGAGPGLAALGGAGRGGDHA